MKATSVFGGVQIFNIIISIIRSKFVAILLGPTGMGISGLLSATLAMIAALTNFGLGTSAVKDIATAQSSGKDARISTVVIVIRRLVWLTGLLGALVTIVFSKLLSQITFGNTEYTWAFIFLSVTLLLNQINVGQKVLLRGMRKISYLAQAGIIGSALGLVTTVPLYYYYGIKGIVPSIIITSVSTLLISWFFASKLKIKPIIVSRGIAIKEGKGMLSLGFIISLSGIISLGASYVVRIYISNIGGVIDVGLYNAGFAIINTYVGLVFTAMGTDYYPRLAASADSNEKSKTIINQQAEIALLIIAPIVMVFLVFINWVVIILYSTKFIPINEMILYAALGIFFKAASWSIAFIFAAKGARKLIFWNELIANSYLLALNIIGYYYWGLTGLGISFLVGYMLYLIQVYVIASIKFEFSFKPEFYKIFSLQLTLAVICLISVKSFDPTIAYMIGSVLIFISVLYTYKELDKRLDLQSLISKYRGK